MAAAVVPTAPAAAAPVVCGQTLTKSVTLDADLDCPDLEPSQAVLRIGASGVTLDLGGHTVHGSGIGIANAGYDDVTVRNGTIAGNRRLVLFSDVSRNTLAQLTLRGIVDGLLVDGGDGNVVTGNSAQGVTFGVRSDHTVVSNNHTSGAEGFLAIVGDRNSIAGNSTDGGALHVGGAQNRVAGNHIRISAPISSTLDGLVDSAFVDNVLISDVRLRVANLVLSDSSRNRLRGNALFGGTLDLRSGYRNVLRRNVVFGAGPAGDLGDGFLVEAPATRTSLIDNLAVSNADDGFDVRAPGTLLRRNRADRNGGYGIRAVPGVVDGGGNRAFGNAAPAQCLNVVCG